MGVNYKHLHRLQEMESGAGYGQERAGQERREVDAMRCRHVRQHYRPIPVPSARNTYRVKSRVDTVH